jgi:hypothetical protein
VVFVLPWRSVLRVSHPFGRIDATATCLRRYRELSARGIAESFLELYTTTALSATPHGSPWTQEDLKAVVLARRKALSDASKSAGNVRRGRLAQDAGCGAVGGDEGGASEASGDMFVARLAQVRRQHAFQESIRSSTSQTQAISFIDPVRLVSWRPRSRSKGGVSRRQAGRRSLPNAFIADVEVISCAGP